MEESDSASVTCEVARNDLSHSANLFCVLSGSTRWWVFLTVAVFAFHCCCCSLKEKENLPKLQHIWNEDLRICRYSIEMHSQLYYPLTAGGRSAVFKGIIIVCFLAVICVCWAKAGHDRAHNLICTVLLSPGSSPLLNQAYNEQSRFFGELTHLVVHRFVAL